MSTEAQGIDARAGLTNWLGALTGMYSADIRAIPDDKWNATFGGCTRPASALTADAVSMLIWTTEAMKGNIMGDYAESMDALHKEMEDKEVALAKFVSCIADFNATLTAASDEMLNSVVTPPWQLPTPMIMMCHIAVSHVWYHDGQLNYIQCLLGDDKVHWMGD